MKGIMIMRRPKGLREEMTSPRYIENISSYFLQQSRCMAWVNLRCSCSNILNDFQKWCRKEDGSEHVTKRHSTLPTYPALLFTLPRNPPKMAHNQNAPHPSLSLFLPLSSPSLIILPLILLTATHLSGGGMEQYCLSYITLETPFFRGILKKDLANWIEYVVKCNSSCNKRIIIREGAGPSEDVGKWKKQNQVKMGLSENGTEWKKGWVKKQGLVENRGE